jgi:hypothetical protein
MTNKLSLEDLDQVSGGALLAPQFYASHLRHEGVYGYQLSIDMKAYDTIYANSVRRDLLRDGKPWLDPL